MDVKVRRVVLLALGIVKKAIAPCHGIVRTVCGPFYISD